VVIADVNDDGKNDIVVIYTDKLGIYLQGNNGTLISEQVYAVPSGPSQEVVIGDVNGDGFNDVVIANGDSLVMLYNGEGPAIPNISASPASVYFGVVFFENKSYQTITIYNSGTGDLRINSIDISGVNANEFSQENDCLTVRPGSSCHVYAGFIPISEGTKHSILTISSNDPNSPTVCVTFTSSASPKLLHHPIFFPAGRTRGEAVAIGDVNGDGRNDVVMTTGSNNDPENDYKIHVFLQNQFGQLDPQIKYPRNSSSIYNSPTSIDIGDVNHDGRADVVVGNSGSNIQVFLQNTLGGLDPGISYPTVNSRRIRIGDLNNDGLLDVVGIGFGTNTVDIFFQNSSGDLNLPVTHAVIDGGYYADVDLEDVNNDGLTDIIVTNGQGFGVLLQRSGGSFDPAIYYSLGGNEYVQGMG
jgi:hypothetical protein